MLMHGFTFLRISRSHKKRAGTVAAKLRVIMRIYEGCKLGLKRAERIIKAWWQKKKEKIQECAHDVNKGASKAGAVETIQMERESNR